MRERGWMGGKQESMPLVGFPNHICTLVLRNTSLCVFVRLSDFQLFPAESRHGYSLTDFSFFSSCLGVKGNVQGNLFKVITKDDIHYYIQASSKAERSEWIEAIKKLT